MTSITNDHQAGGVDAKKAGRIGARPTHERLTPRCRLDDELIDEFVIATKRITDEVLSDSEPRSDDVPGFRCERRRLYPHVVGQKRRTDHLNDQDDTGEPRGDLQRTSEANETCTRYLTLRLTCAMAALESVTIAGSVRPMVRAAAVESGRSAR